MEWLWLFKNFCFQVKYYYGMKIAKKLLEIFGVVSHNRTLTRIRVLELAYDDSTAQFQQKADVASNRSSTEFQF